MADTSFDTRLRPLRDGAAPAHPGDTLQVAALSTPEHVLLCAIRTWVDAARRNVDPLPGLEEGFTHAGLGAALERFDGVMTVTATAATHSLDIRCLKCGGVGTGEIDLIAVVALLQWRHGDRALARAGSWLAPGACRLAMPCFNDLARSMSAQRLVLPLRTQYAPPDATTEGARSMHHAGNLTLQ